MKKFFCHVLIDKLELNYYQNYEMISTNKENYLRCVVRERFKEIDFFKKKNCEIFYLKKNNTFVDVDFNKININNCIIFPRCTVSEIDIIIPQILNNGGISINNMSDYYSILNWPDFIKTKRKILKTKSLILNKISNHFFSKEYSIMGKFFLKTVKKSEISYIVDMNNNSWAIDILHLINNLNIDIIISEPVTILEDSLGKMEYRCYIINNKLVNISRFFDYSHDLDDVISFDVENYALDLIKECKNIFPSSYVLDLFITQKYGIEVCEINNIFASGRYENNDVESLYDAFINI